MLDISKYQWTCSNIFITAQLNHNNELSNKNSGRGTGATGPKFSKVFFTLLAITAFKGWLSFRLLLMWRERANLAAGSPVVDWRE